MNKFQLNISVRWADLDPNGHVRHSAYYDYGAQARVAYLQQQGVGIDLMATQGVGPVIFREECRFRRELHFGDDLVIDMRTKGFSADYRKWSLQHRILRQDEMCAIMDIDGAWFDLKKRRVIKPFEQVSKVFETLERTEDFQMIE